MTTGPAREPEYRAVPGGPSITLAFNNRPFTLALPQAGDISVELRDMQGRRVWSGGGPNGSRAPIASGVKPGIYHFTAGNGKSITRGRISLY